MFPHSIVSANGKSVHVTRTDAGTALSTSSGTNLSNGNFHEESASASILHTFAQKTDFSTLSLATTAQLEETDYRRAANVKTLPRSAILTMSPASAKISRKMTKRKQQGENGKNEIGQSCITDQWTNNKQQGTLRTNECYTDNDFRTIRRSDKKDTNSSYLNSKKIRAELLLIRQIVAKFFDKLVQPVMEFTLSEQSRACDVLVEALGQRYKIVRDRYKAKLHSSWDKLLRQ